MPVFEGILHETKKPAILQTISVSMIRERFLTDSMPPLRIVGRDGHWYRVRPSGRLRMWKRDATRVELPVKYGMYQSYTLRSHDFNAGQVAYVVSE